MITLVIICVGTVFGRIWRFFPSPSNQGVSILLASNHDIVTSQIPLFLGADHVMFSSINIYFVRLFRDIKEFRSLTKAGGNFCRIVHVMLFVVRYKQYYIWTLKKYNFSVKSYFFLKTEQCSDIMCVDVFFISLF